VCFENEFFSFYFRQDAGQYGGGGSRYLSVLTKNKINISINIYLLLNAMKNNIISNNSIKECRP